MNQKNLGRRLTLIYLSPFLCSSEWMRVRPGLLVPTCKDNILSQKF